MEETTQNIPIWNLHCQCACLCTCCIDECGMENPYCVDAAIDCTNHWGLCTNMRFSFSHFCRKISVLPNPNYFSCLTSFRSQGAWETWSCAVLRQVRLRQPFPAPGRLGLSKGESPLPPQRSPGKAWVTTVKIISYAEFMACWVGLHCVVSEVWKQKPVICGMTFFFFPFCISQFRVELSGMPSAGLVLNSFSSFHIIFHSCNM